MSADIDATSVDTAALTRLLDRFAHVSVASRDARELTDWLLRQVSEFTGWPVAHAYLIDPHGAVTTWLSARTGETGWETYLLAADSLAMRTPTGLIDRVIFTRRPAWVSDIGTEADYPRAAAAKSAGLRGVFALPVVRGGHVVAVLQFLSPAPIEPPADFLDGMSIVGFLLGVAFDQVRVQGEPVDQPSRLHRIADAGGRALVAVGANGRIAAWTSGAERLLGWTKSEAMHRKAADLLALPPRSDGHFDTDRPGEHHQVLLRRRDGSSVPAEVARWSVPSAGIRYFFFLRDVSEREQRLSGSSLDPLTGLANRARIMDLLAEQLARGGARRQRRPVLLLIGLHRFKEIDYSLDHHVADEALRIVGKRLEDFAARATRQQAFAATSDEPHPAATVARLAGDEFAILFESSGGTTDIASLAERAVEAISGPIGGGGRRLALTAHVGAAEPQEGSDAVSWFGDADAALYRSRHSPGPARKLHANFEIEGFARRQGGSWRQSLPVEMQGAIREGQFELYYQPVFTLPDCTLVGAEALIRWNHPQHGLLLPGAFIDAAEESGVIAPIGEWALMDAARRLHSWNGTQLSIAVNLSARQLADPGIVARVTEAVNVLGGSSSERGLVVEMTETVLMADPAVAATRIGQFRDMGVRVAVDDFGTGYSSLSYLKWFDVDILKIDMSFVHGLGTNRTDSVIVRSIIDMARALDLQVVAEGVETDEQLRRLTELGATHVQGFGLGRPGPATQLTALIERGAAAGTTRVQAQDSSEGL